jgi:beta-mannosidase
MNYAYRGWRRHWGVPSSRRCGGALVWQLNDCWPTTSWAVVDHFLVKKPAFYAIKRSMAPVSVTVLRAYEDWTAGHAHPPTTSKYDVWVASSNTSVVKDAVLDLRFISIRTGEESQSQQRRTIKIQPNCTTVVCENISINHPRSRDAFVIFTKLLVNNQVVSTHVDWPQPYKYLSFDDRGLRVNLSESRSQISISVLKPVKGLIFDERPGLWFSDNGLDIVPGEEYSVDVQGLEESESLGWTFLGMS